MKRILRIYYLNIKSIRGRAWLGMFWLGVFGLVFFLLSPPDGDPDVIFGPIIIIVVCYLFALLGDARSVPYYKSKNTRVDNSVENIDTYVGEYKNKKKDGQGTMTWASGNKYEGEWKDDKRHGQGSMRDPYGNYEGEWKDDKRHGQGKSFDFGDEYNGEWKNGKKYGQGTMIWASGNKYEGEWKDDKMHGQGSLTVNSASSLGLSSSVDGKILNGQFENNKFLDE